MACYSLWVKARHIHKLNGNLNIKRLLKGHQLEIFEFFEFFESSSFGESLENGEIVYNYL